MKEANANLWKSMIANIGMCGSFFLYVTERDFHPFLFPLPLSLSLSLFLLHLTSNFLRKIQIFIALFSSHTPRRAKSQQTKGE
jgi:hypothetical protein